MATKYQAAATAADTEKFRLRSFVDRLVDMGEVEVVGAPIPLLDLGAKLDGNAKAVLFRKAGPEGAEIVGNVLGSRRRIALAFGVEERELTAEIMRRLAVPQAVVEVDARDAPVQQVVRTGADADLTRLPAHLQHALDGGPYISSGIDYVVDPETGWTNVGSRRLMLTGRQEAGIDLVAPSDLRAIYLKSVARGERLAVSFALGSHPTDFMAASMRMPVDELGIVAALRGEPLAVVRCRTNGILVPADAEMILEGYLDERGHVEAEGPYGEFFGYYGAMKQNPVFHLTAVTCRRDALFQTTTISGRYLKHTETAHIGAVRTEITVWNALRSAVREPVAVFASPASNGSNNVRIALRVRYPGEAKNAIAATMGSLANVKHVFVVDDDIDIFSDEQMDWALGTRFQADRDLVVEGGFRAMPLDPSLDGKRHAGKAGFDLTIPLDRRDALEYKVPVPPKRQTARFQTVRQALESKPLFFGDIVGALGSSDGREVVRELAELRRQGLITRLAQGEYALKTS
jgi:UbiD family decarboxylase